MILKPYKRRTFLKASAAATAVIAGAPYIKTARSAGSLRLGLWDHWVPGANDVLTEICDAWGKANGVDVTIDYITSIGFKNILTAQAEARARTGHDIMAHPTWQVSIHRDVLEPVDDVVAAITQKHGAYIPTADYLCKFDGTWRAIPAPIGSHTYPMVSRIDLFNDIAGVDLLKIFPTDGSPRDPELVESWNYDNFLIAAKKLHAAGHAFGNPIGATSDSQDWLGPLFMSFGSVMVNADGDITVNSDETRQALSYMKELTAAMPADVYAWDDAGNNRWIVSGKGSCMQNPPSAWTVAKRDKPEVAAQLIHHDTPKGPNGRFRGSLPYLWGIWEFSENKQAAKDLLIYLAEREAVDRLLKATQGFDMPLTPSYYDNPVWLEEQPPKGTLYNYPIRGDEQAIVTGYPAPPPIATQIYTQGLIPVMVARHTQGGDSMDDAIAWAENELEGYMRG